MRQLDAIVDEVQEARDAIAKEFGYDIERIAEAFRTREASSGRTMENPPPGKSTSARKAS